MRNKSSGTYYLRAKVGGKIIRRSLGTRKLAVAKIKRDSLLGQLRAQAGSLTKPQCADVSDLIEMTMAYYQAIPSYRIKPASMRYRSQILDSLRETLPRRNVSQWTAKDMRDWWSSHAVKRYSAQRQNNILGTVRKMMDMAIEAGVRVSDPTAGIKRLPVRYAPVSPPSREGFGRIVQEIRSQRKAASEETANMVEFLAYSGMRISEARAVTWEDVHADHILVTGGEQGTKNHEVRRVPIIQPMEALLARMRYEGASGPVWTIKQPRHALENACKRLGLPHVRIHDLRHLFATTCIESGVDIPTISRWLGHKDGGVLALKTYGHLRDEHSMREAAKVRF